MISVVCVFNSKEKLDQRLLASLKRQTARHELILIDNRDSRFENASDALNDGASMAGGDWIAFVHQDISFLSDNWLEAADSTLETYQPEGWIGVIGWNNSEVMCGFVQDRDRLLGTPFDGLVEVQTVDECVLIRKRHSSAEPYFDRMLKGWHVYGVEACCRAIVNGKRNFVLGLPVWHDSASSNFDGLEEAHRYIWDKYRNLISPIYTTCGTLPDTYGWGATNGVHTRYVDQALFKLLKESGITVTRHNFLGMTLESLTETYSSIEVIHPPAPTKEIKVRAFAPQSQNPRTVTHRFTGRDTPTDLESCIVIMPEMASELLDEDLDIENLFPKNPAVFLCLPLFSWRLPQILRRWKSMRACNLAAHRTFDVEDQSRYVAVLGRERSSAQS